MNRRGIVLLATSLSGLIYGVPAESSTVGIGITIATLLIMPVLGWRKRKISRAIGNAALAADAVQSATCAYLAGITLTGLVLNPFFQLAWVDNLAALAAVPILLIEGRPTLRGESCCR
jgi:divalent metal cation (Fe/Co/Zn/Cd) transporter